jgi:hypothetical protein
MNDKQKFEQLVKAPDKLNMGHIPMLEKLLESFPYCQTTQILYAYSLKRAHNIYFNHQLRVAAAYAGNRNLLRKLLQEVPEPGTQHEAAEKKSPVSETAKAGEKDMEVKEDTKVVRDDTPPMEKDTARNRETSDISDQEPLPVGEATKSSSEPKEKNHDSKRPSKESGISEKRFTHVGYPYSDTVSSSEPESDSLKTKRKRQINTLKEQLEALRQERDKIQQIISEEREARVKTDEITSDTERTQADPENITSDKHENQQNSEAAANLSKQEIIDRFIENEPSITKSGPVFYDPSEAAKQSIRENDNLVTETMAKLLVKQGKFLQAIRIYRKLSLKFPQKSSYFASQIKQIEDNYQD